MIQVPKNEYVIIRTDGRIEKYQGPAKLGKVKADIGVNCIDTVVLTKDQFGFTADLVMIIDDTGALTDRFINQKATELYHEVKRTDWPIHGDVAICHDEDFA